MFQNKLVKKENWILIVYLILEDTKIMKYMIYMFKIVFFSSMFWKNSKKKKVMDAWGIEPQASTMQM